MKPNQNVNNIIYIITDAILFQIFNYLGG